MAIKPDLGALFGAGDSKTFLGLPSYTESKEVRASSVFIGAPGATPYGAVGSYCKNAPSALRKSIASLSANIDRYNFDLGGPTFPAGALTAMDFGDLPLHETDFSKNRKVIYDAVSSVMSSGAVPIVVGGDDSVPIPMLQALESSGDEYTILQIDAHIDWRKSHMDESQGLSSTMRRASDGTNIVVCLDVDAMDPSIVPGVIGRTPGGLDYYQVLDLIKGAAERGRIASIDFVEYMPEVDVDDLGALVVSRLIASTMGMLARQQQA